MKKNKLYAAILGDLAGNPYEFPIMEHFPPIETINLHNPESQFSDDTLMTLATAKAILDSQSFEEAYKEVGFQYQGDHYGKDFKQWLNSPTPTQGTSWGNGCIMRLSPIMYLKETYSEVEIRNLIIKSCMVSHSNAISLIASLDLSDYYHDADIIKDGIYSFKDGIYSFKEPQRFKHFAVKADETLDFCSKIFFGFTSTHDAIKKAISCGGDTDTNASIIGEWFNYTYQDLTQEDIDYVESRLDPYLLDILHRFNAKTL